MSPCTYFLFVFGEALELAYILLFGIPIYLTLSCIKIWIKKKKMNLLSFVRIAWRRGWRMWKVRMSIFGEDHSPSNSQGNLESNLCCVTEG